MVRDQLPAQQGWISAQAGAAVFGDVRYLPVSQRPTTPIPSPRHRYITQNTPPIAILCWARDHQSAIPAPRQPFTVQAVSKTMKRQRWAVRRTSFLPGDRYTDAIVASPGEGQQTTVTSNELA